MSDTPPPTPTTLTLTPIGYARTPFRERAEAPRQPRVAPHARGVLSLLPGNRYEAALCDLEGWDYLWVLFWFDRNEGWRPQVLPPRSRKRRGVFSTRAPHRPNPLGLSVVRLERVQHLDVYVSELDLLDGTPILDLKPYVPWSDAIPDARTGWLGADEGSDPDMPDALGRPGDPVPGSTVRIGPVARVQLDWLATEHDVQLEEGVRRGLAMGISERHPYRRIKREGEGWVLAVQAWRARFVEGDDGVLEVRALRSGYRDDALASEPGIDVHRAFVARFGAGWAA